MHSLGARIPILVMAVLLQAGIAAAQVRAVLLAGGFNSPVAMVQHPADREVFVVVEQGGRLRVIRSGVVQSTLFLDLRNDIASGGERGVLGLAFDPNYAVNRRIFVNFTNTSGHTVVARFTTFASDPYRADPASRFDLRWGGPSGSRFISQPFANHNGGHLAFGPDGYLYIGLGDGGSGGDPDNRAQDPTTLLGKLLRIDVGVDESHSEGYVVPSSNPYAGGGALPEIWAVGLRNPWRYSFDTTFSGGVGSNGLFLADVGQSAREEINYQRAGRPALNYGWRLYEGQQSYLPETPAFSSPLTSPIFDYPRSEGQSVTGGYVYRGRGLRSGFRGRYFYADFVSGRVWSLGISFTGDLDASVTDRLEHTSELGTLGNIASFARDNDGELYLLSFNGNIYRIADDPGATGPVGGVVGGASLPPFGQVDTPTQGATGVMGALGITGWALDDGGVSTVRIYRNCLAFDEATSCQVIGGHNVVLLGDAVFVPGARPDVAAAIQGYPGSHRAGWGFLVLTNMLPHQPQQAAYGGQGTIQLYAFAADAEGHLTLLGRTQTDQTPTTITLDNDNITTPFGTIDTPSQGGTTSGVFANFGWALTPDTNTTADGSDILMPLTGATMRVFVDGTPVGTVTYNLCRGSVGSSVPAGVFCDDDVANAFGNATPQPALTTRFSNPTRFRNLDSGRGAIGLFQLDTTSMQNGMHTIAWGVTDSAGRASGLGSRTFVVANSTPDVPVVASSPAVSTVDGSVKGQHGFDPRAAFIDIVPGADGERRVLVGVPDRLALRFGGAISDAYLEVNGARAALPVGAFLDVDTSTLSWTPAAGFLGDYRLVVVMDGQPTAVTVTVDPNLGLDDGRAVRMHVDHAIAQASSRLLIEGWAFDPKAFTGSGIGAVHVWATRLDVAAAEPVFIGEAQAVARPDMAAAFGPTRMNAGFRLHTSLRSGLYSVTAYVWSARTGRWEDARTVTVRVP